MSGKVKNQHQSASKVLSPANLKKLREVKMKNNTRPKLNCPIVKYEYADVSGKKVYEFDITCKNELSNSARSSRAGKLKKHAGARARVARILPLGKATKSSFLKK